jgi:hypothetical protein
MLTEQRLAELHQLRANGLSMRKCAAILGTNESMVYSALHPKVRKPKLKLPPPPKRPSTLPVKELRDHYCCPTPKFNPTWRQQAPELTHEDFIEAWKNTAKPPTPSARPHARRRRRRRNGLAPAP